jgi:hypothetical protein
VEVEVEEVEVWVWVEVGVLRGRCLPWRMAA